jgi:PLP dependent protein
MNLAPLEQSSPLGLAGLRERFAAQRARIELAAAKAGRPFDQVKLLAVSKRQPAASIRAAYELGQRDFGENYAQELADKAEELRDLVGLRWHMIGHLQTNKARIVAPLVHNVSSVDSLRLVRELGKQVARNRPLARGELEILVEVNIGREAQKGGALPEEVPELLDAVASTPRLRLGGLLCIPPETPQPEGARPFFRALRDLQAALGGAERLPELSMGMSGDLEIAIAEGATWVRVGTALFGERT